MVRRFTSLVVWFSLVASAGVIAPYNCTDAQEKPPAKVTPAPKEKNPPKVKPSAQEKPGALDKVTPEQVAEIAIYINGGRDGMAQVRKTGIERGRITRAIADGKTEDATYERRVIRGENMEKDRIRLDQKMPTAEYSLVFASGQIWGIINDAVFTPRQETIQDFLAPQWHGIDTLLRYKENGSTIKYVGKDKQKGLDLHVIDVTDKALRVTRVYVSAKTARVLWLEYEQRPDSGGDPVKFVRKFHDYHIVQGTLVPYWTVLYKDGNQIEETHVLTITFGPKLDEALFSNPEAPPPTTASKP